ncbi:hypothetical protein FA13DRAFT_1707159 [Coprinellus micaceus]|uniref:Uncharacterized protein n=1 Tax=Coprinellus micaceus TaxID=71717 RepID=A0A4Y7TLC3_COPMI|nr:hypothetical protein FA13DRAFT_1707159 [Coprinellus micaceus]
MEALSGSPSPLPSDAIAQYHETHHHEIEAIYLRLLEEHTRAVRDNLLIKQERDWLTNEVNHFVDDQLDNRVKFTGASHQIRLELIKMGKLLGLQPGTTSTDRQDVAGDGSFYDVHRRLCRIMDDWDRWDDVMRAKFNERECETANPYA